jgi:hypothetical protein
VDPAVRRQDVNEERTAALLKKGFTHYPKLTNQRRNTARQELDLIARYQQRFPNASASEATLASVFLRSRGMSKKSRPASSSAGA